MERRAFLKLTVIGPMAASSSRIAAAAGADRWRTFEVTTRVDVLNPSGLSRVWVPLPLAENTDYHKTLGRAWGGNAANVQIVRDPRYGAELVAAEWPAGTSAPTLDVIARITTRDRQVNAGAPATGAT